MGARATWSRVGAKAGGVPAVPGLGAVRPFASEGERARRAGGLAPGFSFGRLPIQAKPAAAGVLQPKCDQCEEEQKIQPKGEGASVGGMGGPPIVQQVLRSPGQPLDPGTRAHMESRFGHDFSRVRVHADTTAAESARAVHAQAYTQGEHIVFARDRYAPTTAEGKKLVGHELAHVVQQSAGRVVSPASSGEVPIVTNPLLEEEADAAGEKVARGELARVSGMSGGAAQLKAQGGPIQRDCDPNTQSCDPSQAIDPNAGQPNQGPAICDPSNQSCPLGTVDPNGQPNPGIDAATSPQPDDAQPNQGAPATCDPSNHSCPIGTVDPNGQPNPGTDASTAPQPDDAGTVPQDCKDLCEALSDSQKVIDLYTRFQSGDVTWDEMNKHRRMVGNAAQGVTTEGKKKPKVVQDAIGEVENFSVGEEGSQMVKLLKSAFGSKKDLQEEHVRIEIERQKHFNEIVQRKLAEKDCPSCGAR